MTVDVLLTRLDAVRQVGPGRWLARCPAHDDRHASLSLRELDDGRVLVHDFAGCSVEDVLAAAGLTFDALYPEQASGHQAQAIPLSIRGPARAAGAGDGDHHRRAVCSGRARRPCAQSSGSRAVPARVQHHRAGTGVLRWELKVGRTARWPVRSGPTSGRRTRRPRSPTLARCIGSTAAVVCGCATSWTPWRASWGMH